ncbi:hypothetical protein [Nocardia bovistercoris]|uniref:Uncharacterized protein n=1 Tax=Nocardia bovistercoris TaxID=2785916 RepID=A0A931N658_9NOCA|nr:hypothetical protein [Nocardia bovistercoris]MBH0780141.1 hypothetical protein [Nocardia bovistercoris]
MKRLGPWITLAAVAVLGIVLLIVNMSKETEPTATTTATTAVTTTAVTTTAAPAPSSAPAAPPAPGFPAQADYVGKIAERAAGALTLEITVEGGKAVAYACDGRSVESWLQGDVSNGTLRLTGKNGATLDGASTGAGVRGTLAVGDGRWEFTAAPVSPPAGLYVYTDNGVRQSWIIDASGGVTGVQRAADGATSPAPALAPNATATVGGRTVTANKVSGDDNVG